MPSPAVSRVVGGAALLTGGYFSLPLTAAVLDHRVGDREWILPAVQVAGITAFGAGVGAALPEIAGRGASRLRGATVGAAAGIGAAAIGTALLYGFFTGFGR